MSLRGQTNGPRLRRRINSILSDCRKTPVVVHCWYLAQRWKFYLLTSCLQWCHNFSVTQNDFGKDDNDQKRQENQEKQTENPQLYYFNLFKWKNETLSVLCGNRCLVILLLSVSVSTSARLPSNIQTSHSHISLLTHWASSTKWWLLTCNQLNFSKL